MYGTVTFDEIPPLLRHCYDSEEQEAKFDLFFNDAPVRCTMDFHFEGLTPLDNRDGGDSEEGSEPGAE